MRLTIPKIARSAVF